MAAAVEKFPGDVSKEDPFDDFFAISKSDTVDMPYRTRGIYVGGAGDVVVLAKDGTTSVTFKAVPVGTTLRIRTNRVMAATTATLLIGLI